MAEFAFTAKIVEKDDDQYTLEVQPGMKVLLSAKEVEQIDEYIEPRTGMPVAKVRLKEGADLRTSIKTEMLRDVIEAGSAAPFTLGGGGSISASSPVGLTPIDPTFGGGFPGSLGGQVPIIPGIPGIPDPRDQFGGRGTVFNDTASNTDTWCRRPPFFPIVKDDSTGDIGPGY